MHISVSLICLTALHHHCLTLMQYSITMKIMRFNEETYRTHLWKGFARRCMACQAKTAYVYLLKLVVLRKDQNDRRKSKSMCYKQDHELLF